ncbi:hypothetical protein DPMN_151169 [Dreissena polymorpha]|uniref:Uncharacterized protein n=1 Tax=Dreissena polymorpha TaxID=45954 RepID=A0A9D4J2Q2_DREPO|nr:hypothetical protein DPMN_151169 [Dreissena polymorpha]
MLSWNKPTKSAPSPSSHEINILSKFHENLVKNVSSTVFTCFHYIHIKKNAPPTGGHVFSPIPTIFKLVRAINKTNVLTNCQDFGQTLENCNYIHIEINAPPTGGHVFSPISTIFELPNKENCPAHWRPCFSTDQIHFELNQDIIKTNILTNFELGRDFIGTKLLTTLGQEIKCFRTDGRTYDGQRPVTKAHLINQDS